MSFLKRANQINQSSLGYWKDETPEVWHSILDTFFFLVAWDMEYNKMPEVVVTDVKEKFGALRIYYNGGDRITDAYAMFAMRMSEQILLGD